MYLMLRQECVPFLVYGSFRYKYQGEGGWGNSELQCYRGGMVQKNSEKKK